MAAPENAGITGLLLAGGEGRRMGGQDKGLLAYRGRALAQHILERLRPQVDHLLISANRHTDRYTAFGAPVVQDLLPDYAGPLAGLQAGLAACKTPLIATAPCDVPGFPADLVAQLAIAIDHGAPLAWAETGVRSHPIFMLCRRDVAPALDRYLAEGGRKIREWQGRIGGVPVRFPDEAAFANLNRPEDLE